MVQVYQYPNVHLHEEDLVGNWTMFQVLPGPLNPFCQQMGTERECRANDKCAWCNGDQCLYKMESKRPGNQCRMGQQTPDEEDNVTSTRLSESGIRSSVLIFYTALFCSGR